MHGMHVGIKKNRYRYLQVRFQDNVFLLIYKKAEECKKIRDGFFILSRRQSSRCYIYISIFTIYSVFSDSSDPQLFKELSYTFISSVLQKLVVW